MGRVSNPSGPPSSNESVIFIVGAISRIAATPAHVMSDSRILCLSVNREPERTWGLSSGGDEVTLTVAIVASVEEKE